MLITVMFSAYFMPGIFIILIIGLVHIALEPFTF